MSDPLQFLSGQPAQADTAQPEIVDTTPAEAPAAEATPPEAPARGADGKFVAKATEAAAPVPETATAAVSEPVAAPAEPGHVPISALLDEREKRQAENAARKDLERQLAELKAQAAPQEPPTQDEALRQALYAQNMRSSRRFAEREYGKETIATVHDWAAKRCDDDPLFNQQMFASEDPYETAYQAYNREQIIAQVKPDDFAAFKAWQAAQAAAQAQPAAPPTPASAPPAPRSLANAPGNGSPGVGHVPAGPGQAFASVIPR